VSFLPTIVVLLPAALFALYLARARPSPPTLQEQRTRAVRVFGLMVLLQAIHFVEEASTGLNVRLPEAFGLPAIPFATFVLFNLLWLGIWVVSLWGLGSGHPAAFFAAWFLALAGVLNGLLHPVLAVAAGGYFPGVLTSTIIGIVAVWLVMRLAAATRSVGESPTHGTG
jgi:hypothetical protein